MKLGKVEASVTVQAIVMVPLDSVAAAPPGEYIPNDTPLAVTRIGLSPVPQTAAEAGAATASEVRPRR